MSEYLSGKGDRLVPRPATPQKPRDTKDTLLAILTAAHCFRRQDKIFPGISAGEIADAMCAVIRLMEPKDAPAGSPLTHGDVDCPSDTDGASASYVLTNIALCSASWHENARILGNIRAGDINRAVNQALEWWAQFPKPEADATPSGIPADWLAAKDHGLARRIQSRLEAAIVPVPSLIHADPMSPERRRLAELLATIASDISAKIRADGWTPPGTITTNGRTRVIPHGEPVFLIRGQDKVGAAAVRTWAELAKAAGADAEIVGLARKVAEEMEIWQPKKVPDLPK